MALLFNKTTRDLAIRGVLTLTTGEQIQISDDEIISYSSSGSVGAEGLPLGTTEAVSYTLTLDNVGRRFTPSQLDNAEVHMLVGIKDGDSYTYNDFGVWYVNDSNAPEQSVAITLSGFDALATRFSAYFTDSAAAYPSTIGSLARTVCAAAGIQLTRTDFPNAAVVIPIMPIWPEETTLRDILGFCAVCAAGFVRMTRSGLVDIVSYADGTEYELDPGMYHTFTPTGGYAFDFNSIEAFMSEDADERTRYAVNSSIKSNATNTIQIDYNPLLTDSILQSIVNELAGISLVAGKLSWGGDPAVMLGDNYRLEDMKGIVHQIMVTSQSFNFGGGLNVVESCTLPALNSQHGATYSTSTNMYDAKGNIRATRISGLDKSVVSATVGHFESLTAETATFDRLLTAVLEAMNLTANMLDAAIIKAGSISTDKLHADIVTADDVKTLSLESVTAKIESLTAADITTDRLAAGLAAFTVITAGTASFDQATVQHLVANAMNLTFGTAGEVFIENLRVVYGQMVQATIGNLCIKASDGNYYNIDVNADGNVTATQTTVTDGEISAGETDAGRVILETNITAESLNTGNLLATYALINKIDAARIDVDELFANSAFIAHLQTADISSNTSIKITAGKAEEALKEALDAAAAAAGAQGTADSAKADAADAQSTANSASSTADAAQSTANSASAAASNAQNTANAAQTAADKARSAADSASSAAAKAQSTADSASTAASNAQNKADSAYNLANGGVSGVDVQYYLSTSATQLSGGTWQTVAPEWVNGKYMWQRTVTTYKNGTTSTSNPTCIAGATGPQGDDGVGVSSIVEQFYLSESKETQTGGSWVEEMPTWQHGYYVWTRSKITYTNGTVAYTEPYCDTGWEAANEAQTIATNAGATASAAVAAIGEIPNYVEVASDGLYLKDENMASVLKINSASVSIGTLTGDAAGYSQLAANYVQFGNYQLRKSADGGLVFKLKE